MSFTFTQHQPYIYETRVYLVYVAPQWRCEMKEQSNRRKICKALWPTTKCCCCCCFGVNVRPLWWDDSALHNYITMIITALLLLGWLPSSCRLFIKLNVRENLIYAIWSTVAAAAAQKCTQLFLLYSMSYIYFHYYDAYYINNNNNNGNRKLYCVTRPWHQTMIFCSAFEHFFFRKQWMRARESLSYVKYFLCTTYIYD